MKKIFIFVIAILIIAGAFFIFSGKLGVTGNVVKNSNEDITISVSEISGTAKFYEQDGIRFFAVKADDGSVKTAFDACDVCYYSKKGYRQEGDYMVCNNCGNKYPIIGLGTENLRGGGCWPGYLPSRIEGENLIIKTSDLEKGSYRFSQ